MASLSAVFTEKERTNWLKAWLAVDVAKSGLEQFVANEAKTLHANIYNTVWSNIRAPAACIGCDTANLLKCPTQGVCNKRGTHGTCKSMHDTTAKQPRHCPANVCNKVCDEIVKHHKFSNPSWKNTTAKQWATNPWQITKAYLPPDGYFGKCSVQETDLNGIISFMMNCTHFDNRFSFSIATGKQNPPCLLTKAREIGRTVRHSPQCKVTDQDLQDIFTTLSNLLSDPTCLAHDVAAGEAAIKLAELRNDVLKITTKEMIHLLEASQETLKKFKNIADKSLDEIQVHIEQCRKELKAHTDKCKLELDEHTAKCTNAIDEHVTKTVESTYEQSCKELIKGMKKLYNGNLNHVTISPLNDSVDKKLRDVYMPPNICAMSMDKGAFKKTDKLITKYKDVFLTDDKVNQRMFIQGEAGSGKTTFLAKLALDWCEQISCAMESLSTNESNTSSVTSEKFDRSSASSETSEHMVMSRACSLTSETMDMSSASSVTSEESDISCASDSSAEDSDTSDMGLHIETFGHANNSSHIFADLDVLKDYMFVFHITLRNSVKQLNVTDMIETQLIDSIYYSPEDREKAYRLVNEIMKRERCLVLLDGLDEWTGPDGHPNLPILVAFHSECVMLITTRPWKLAEGQIRHSDIDALLQLEGIQQPFALSRIILSGMVDKKDLNTKHLAFRLYIENQKLSKLLSSPIMLSVIVCSFADGMELKGSMCQIYILLLESLFKKANSAMCEWQQPSFPCFTGTQYIQPNIEHQNRLAEMAFHLLFLSTKENSLVFSIMELKKFKMAEREQKDFALKSGILSATRNASTLRSSSLYMFIHLSIQEFLAAYHIARNTNLIDDVMSGYLTSYKGAYLDIAQVFIFLCGLDKSGAEKLSSMMNERIDFDAHADHFPFQVANPSSFQKIILAGYREAVANEHTDIALKLSYFSFIEHNNDLYRIWTNNAPDVISLKVMMDTTNYENRRIPPANDVSLSDMKFDLSSCRKLKTLALAGNYALLKDSGSSATSKLPVSIVLNSADPSQCTHPPAVLPSIERIKLSNVTCPTTWLGGLFRILLTLDHQVQCKLYGCNITSCEEGSVSTSSTYGIVSITTDVNKSFTIDVHMGETCPGLCEALLWLNIKSLNLSGGSRGLWLNDAKLLSRSLSSLKQLEELSFVVKNDSPSLWEGLRGLNIKRLSLIGAWGDFRVNHEQLMSQSLVSLTQLVTLSIDVSDDSPGLWAALRGLNIKRLSLSGAFGGFRVNHEQLLSQSLVSLTQLVTLSIGVSDDSPRLWAALHGLNIKSLCLHNVFGGFSVRHKESLSQSLSSLKQLETLTLYVHTYVALQLPQTLRYLNIFCNKLLPSELRELVDTLTACTQTVEIELEFGCDFGPPLQTYIPIQQELDARKNVAVKRFRMYDRTLDNDGVDDDSNDDLSLKIYGYKISSKCMFRDVINRISVRLQITPDS